MKYYIFYEGDKIVFEGRGTFADVAERGLNEGKLDTNIHYKVDKFDMVLDDYFIQKL